MDHAAASSSVKTPPEGYVIQMAFGALLTQALYVAASLGLADLLVEKPRSVSELAEATNANERALYRVLRSLASVGIFEEVKPKVFSLNDNSQPLRSDVPNSLRNGLIFMGEEWHWRVWADLMHSVKTGKPAWGKVHGTEVFDYFADHPQQSEIFNRAMTDMAASTAPAIVEAYDFSGIEILADIAGGHGLLLAHILKANPAMKGILFDVPSVIEGAQALLKREDVAARVQTVSGNFFESVPPGADAYLMKHIIHDWDDERSEQILRNIYAVSKAGGKVLVVENVIPENNEPHLGKLMDLEMLVSPGGVERTGEEFRQLFAAGGFRLTRIIPTKSPYSLIEGIKD
jgi:hypothetical protein